MPIPADSVIDAMVAGLPRQPPGTRPSFAAGVTVTGWFQGSSVAGSYSGAEHFQGRRVPVTVRFSNGSARAAEPDSTRTIRGMAVRFHLGGVEFDGPVVCASTVATDLVATTLPAFYTRTVADFVDLTKSWELAEKPAPPWWRAAIDFVVGQVKLLPKPDDPTPGEASLVAFADRYPPARLAAAYTTLVPVPESYATCCYHPVHAFALTARPRPGVRGGGAPALPLASDKRTDVRFHWEPVAGVRPAATKMAGNFLRDELAQRLAGGPAEFVLRAQLAEAGDDTADPTTPWSQRRRKIVMGQLTLTALAPVEDSGADPLCFDPTRMVPGIELCGDEIIAARQAVYLISQARRSAQGSRPELTP